MNKWDQLGTFELNHEKIDLFVDRESDGGAFNLNPEEKPRGYIRIGLLYDDWDACLDTLLHEVYEYQLARMGCRYDSTNSTGTTMDGFLFVLDHQQFTHMHCVAASFLNLTINRLKQAYHKHAKTLRKDKDPYIKKTDESVQRRRGARGN
jgi:hypothetical protein